MTQVATSPHDLNLPDWGPYTKRYIGLSHIADRRRGLRFDLSVFPGFYRRRVDVPNVLWESGYHPWEASPDLRYFAHRHELQGRDEVYCDVAFSAIDEQSRLVCCTCVNRSAAPQTLVLHWMASLNFPAVQSKSHAPLYPASVQLPSGALWVAALDYADLAFATPRPTDTLNPDGLRRGELRGHGFTDGSGIGQGFGREAGDRVTYRPTLDQPLPDAALVLRYRLAPGYAIGLDLGGAANSYIELLGDGSFATVTVPLGNLAAGEQAITIATRGGAGIEIDGFALLAAADAPLVRFIPVRWQPQPEIIPGPHPRSLLLRYPDLDHWYGLAWDSPASGADDAEVRAFHTSDLDATLRVAVHHHTSHVFHGPGDGHFTNVFFRPIPLAPGETLVRHGLVCTGTQEEVEERLRAYAAGAIDAAAIHEANRATRFAPQLSPGGETYAYSQERMAATLLTNVVFPIYARRAYIRHNTPGRWWDSLYTWDSGFIGLGLAELDLDRATDCLRAYLTPEGDPDAAFIHHGSPVPVQHALFLDLWNRTQSRELLEWAYPRLRQYHRFLAGRLGSSTTGALGSGLLQTWDYWYSSGGWDDYPAQVHMHAQELAATVTPVITSAQVIRTAKILGHAAAALGLDADIAEYDADIARFGAALQRHAWDDESGYFGYVQHTKSGTPLDILRDRSGTSLNQGFDGVYPLVAGICTPEQEERLLAHLFTPGRLWTAFGLTAVDQTAPYYRADGYWNGTVWLSHQWYFWKTMLDLGQPDLARRIAQTALDLWQDEVERTRNTCEHFVVATGRGAGWHHFGGLSAPIVQWFAAYHRPGRLTIGLDIWVESCLWGDNHADVTATLSRQGDPRHRAAVLATMHPGRVYLVNWNGDPVEHTVDGSGLITVLLPPGATTGTLAIATATRANWNPHTGPIPNPWREIREE